MRESAPSDTWRLVQSARAGDRASLEQLMERYLPRVRQIVAMRLGRRLGELFELDDLVQESLLDAFRGLQTFEPRSEGSFRSWLARIVESNIQDGRRRASAAKRGAGAVRLGLDPDTSLLTESVLGRRTPTPSQYASAHELGERLEAALLALEERDRRVIELRRLCEMDYGEIAAELGLGEESSARSLFSRAMGHLSERL